MANELKGVKVAILASHGFEQSELTDPKKALEESGAITHVISPESGKIKGWKHGSMEAGEMRSPSMLN